MHSAIASLRLLAIGCQLNMDYPFVSACLWPGQEYVSGDPRANRASSWVHSPLVANFQSVQRGSAPAPVLIGVQARTAAVFAAESCPGQKSRMHPSTFGCFAGVERVGNDRNDSNDRNDTYDAYDAYDTYLVSLQLIPGASHRRKGGGDG